MFVVSVYMQLAAMALCDCIIATASIAAQLKEHFEQYGPVYEATLKMDQDTNKSRCVCVCAVHVGLVMQRNRR